MEITLDSSARTPEKLQAAIDRCSSEGGGTLVIPGGTWPADGVRLRTGVTLRLSAGCTLAGQLVADGARDVGILGEGPNDSVVTGGLGLNDVRGIDCRGWSGRMVFGCHVRDGRFTKLTLLQPPQRHGEGSAVWFLWSSNLHWEDCDLESNDDVFCLKRAASNVTLTRSRLCGRMGAPYKIGTESDGLFENIVFTDSLIEKSDRAAISLESVDGSEIRDVRIERIQMEDIDAPIFIRLGNRDRFGEGPGSIHDILIADVEGYGRVMDEGFGSCITGLPERAVENIVLRDIRYESLGGQSAELFGRVVPERAELYPEFDMFGRLPAHGLYARHVRGLRLERCSWTATNADGRPAIVVEDTAGVETVETSEPVVREPVLPAPGPDLETGDVDALLAAISAAGRDETVIVEPGDYAIPQEKLPILLDTPGVKVESREGPEKTRLRAVGAREHPRRPELSDEPELDMEFDVLFRIAADRVRISGLTLSAAVYNVHAVRAADCAISGNYFDFCKEHHVAARQCRKLLLAGNRSRAALNCSFWLEQCEACVIRGNVFAEDPGGVRMRDSTDCEIAKNHFDAISWDGVVLDTSTRNRVTGNRFVGGRLTGLQLRQSCANEVTANEFSGQKTESVMIDRDSHDNRIRGNSFHDNRGMAVSNETPHPVDAGENWWGSPDGPRPGIDVDANVRVEPWLTEPPYVKG